MSTITRAVLFAGYRVQRRNVIEQVQRFNEMSGEAFLKNVVLEKLFLLGTDIDITNFAEHIQDVVDGDTSNSLLLGQEVVTTARSSSSNKWDKVDLPSISLASVPSLEQLQEVKLQVRDKFEKLLNLQLPEAELFIVFWMS